MPYRTVAVLSVDLNEMTDERSLDLTIYAESEDGQREAIHGYPVGIADQSAVTEVPLADLPRMVADAAAEMGYNLADDARVGVNDYGLYVEVTATRRPEHKR